MSRLLAALAVVLAVAIPGCDTTTTYLQPLEVVFYVSDGQGEREVFRAEVPRSAISEVPLSIFVPPTATGLRLTSDLASSDSVSVVAVARATRLDPYDLPYAAILSGGSPSRDISRGSGGALQPLLLFSTDSLWVGPRSGMQVTAQFGTRTSSQELTRADAAVSTALSVTAGELELDQQPEWRVEIRAEVRGARSLGDLVPVLLSQNDPDALLPASSALQGAVLLRDEGNADHYVLARGRGLKAFTGFQADETQTFSLVLLRP